MRNWSHWSYRNVAQMLTCGQLECMSFARCLCFISWPCRLVNVSYLGNPVSDSRQHYHPIKSSCINVWFLPDSFLSPPPLLFCGEGEKYGKQGDNHRLIAIWTLNGQNNCSYIKQRQNCFDQHVHRESCFMTLRWAPSSWRPLMKCQIYSTGPSTLTHSEQCQRLFDFFVHLQRDG